MLKQNSSAKRKGRARSSSKPSPAMRAQSSSAAKRNGKAKVSRIPSRASPSQPSTATKRGRTITSSTTNAGFSGQSKRASADGAITDLPSIDVPSRPISSRKGKAETKKQTHPTQEPSPQPSSVAMHPLLPMECMRRNARAMLSASTTGTMPEQPISGQTMRDAHMADAGTGDVQLANDNQCRTDIANLIDQVKEQWRRRQMWHRAEKSLTLQAKAMCRRLMAGDKTEAEKLYKSAMNGQDHELAPLAFIAMAPLLNARQVIEKSRTEVEKLLTKDAKNLPAAPFIEATHGIGFMSYAGIIGESGNLGSYGNPAKLWKRMGLAVIKGERQQKKSGQDAIEHGYSPTRRSLMWTIGDCIIKVGGPYREVYDKRKAYEQDKNERGEYAERAARQLKEKSYDKKTEAFKCYSAGKIPPAQIHMSAKRYMEKRLLRDLWRAWRDHFSRDNHVTCVSPTSLPH
jgi:hypothetical protein